MLDIDGYYIEKTLHRGSAADIYAARRLCDGAPVEIKVYRDPATTARESRAGREKTLLERIACSAVVRPLAVELCGDRWALVSEWIAGQAVHRALPEQPLDIAAVLDVACQTCRALGAVHAARVLHGRIAPSNVLIERHTGRVRLLGFEGAVDFADAAEIQGAPLPASAALYMAPERTGLLDRDVDARSDLYSLGATLYRLLTGRAPCERTRADAAPRAYLGRAAEPPHVLEPGVPLALSRIVTRLLQRDPDDRYQTALGLAADLEACRDAWAQTGTLDPALRLGEHDISDTLRFPPRLYGREQESDALAAAYARCLATGPQRVVIHGPPGSGKSSLAEPLAQLVARDGGLLAGGACIAERQAIPYLALRAALEQLAERMAAGVGRSADAWSERLRARLGKLAGVLVELVPAFAPLLPHAAPMPAPAGLDPVARIGEMLSRLAAACTDGAAALVLWLDDVQWLDAESDRLLGEPSHIAPSAHVLLVATHATTPEAPVPPPGSFAHTCAAQPGTQTLPIGPLGAAATHAWLADTLGRTTAETGSLGDRLATQTGRNPLLLRQLLLHLRDTGALRRTSQGWEWDAERVLETEMPQDVAAFIARKIERLPALDLRVLQAAACLGTRFRPEEARGVCDTDGAAVSSALDRLAEMGLLAPCRGALRFVHDHLRESAAALCPPAQRAEHHARAARHLTRTLTSAALEKRAFEIAEHWLAATGAMCAGERIACMHSHVRAGLLALQTGSTVQALRYLDAAAAQEQPSDWQEHRDLAVSIALRRAESLCLSGRYADSERVCAELAGHDPDPIERALLDGILMRLCGLTGRPEGAILIARRAYARLGVRVPARPTRFGVRLKLRELRRVLDRTSEPMLVSCVHRTSTDPTAAARLLLARSAADTMFRYHPAGSLYSTVATVRTALAHGTAYPGALVASSALQEATHGVDAARIRRLCDLSARLHAAIPDPERGHRADVIVTSMCGPRFQHLRRSIEALETAADAADDAGDTPFVRIGRLVSVYFRLFSGAPLAEVGAALERCRRQRGVDGAEPAAILGTVLPGVEQLTGKPGEPSPYVVDLAAIPATTRVLVYTLKAFFDAILGRDIEPLEGAETALPLALANPPPIAPYFCLLHTLQLVDAPAEGYARRHRRRVLLRRYERLLRAWAHGAPQNYLATADIVAAERHSLAGQRAKAVRLYEAGAEHAAQQGFVHLAALALERGARTLLHARRPSQARQLLERASDGYRTWGAHRKVDLLRVLPFGAGARWRP